MLRASCPENTASSFKKALELRPDMIEFDVRLSRDHIPVVFHDALLDFKSNRSGPLKNYSLSRLKALDVGAWFGDAFQGERMLTLAETLRLV